MRQSLRSQAEACATLAANGMIAGGTDFSLCSQRAVAGQLVGWLDGLQQHRSDVVGAAVGAGGGD
jgi:hypothetical protein